MFLHGVLASVVLRRSGGRRVVMREHGRRGRVRRRRPELHAAMCALFLASPEIIGVRRPSAGVVLFRIVGAR